MTSRPGLDRLVVIFLALSMIGGTALCYSRGHISAMAALWIAIGLGVVAYGLMVEPYLRRSYLKVLLLLVPLLAVVGASIHTWVIPVEGVPDTMLPGLVTGSLIAAGWIASALVKVLTDEESRHVTRLDALHKLRSEIFAYCDKLDNQPIRTHADEVQRRIISGDMDSAGNSAPFHPFVIRTNAPLFFAQTSGALPLMSPMTAESVIRFYSTFADMEQLIDDMRHDSFRGLQAERRAGVHEELTKRRMSTLRFGLRAVIELSRELGITHPDRIPRSGHNVEIMP